MGGEGTESVPVDVTDDSNIIAKYPDVPGMSEKATTLTQRKRELILNSKRYYFHIFNDSCFLLKAIPETLYTGLELCVTTSKNG